MVDSTTGSSHSTEKYQGDYEEKEKYRDNDPWEAPEWC